MYDDRNGANISGILAQLKISSWLGESLTGVTLCMLTVISVFQYEAICSDYTIYSTSAHTVSNAYRSLLVIKSYLL